MVMPSGFVFLSTFTKCVFLSFVQLDHLREGGFFVDQHYAIPESAQKIVNIHTDHQEGRASSSGRRKMAAEKKEDSADEK